MSDTKILNINGPLSAMAARMAMQIEALQKRVNNLSGSTNKRISDVGDDTYDALRIAFTTFDTEVRRISNKSERDSKSVSKSNNQKRGPFRDKKTVIPKQTTQKKNNPGQPAAKKAVQQKNNDTKTEVKKTEPSKKPVSEPTSKTDNL